MKLHAQPPVYSPLGPSALIAGLRAGVGDGRAARETVERLLSETYHSPVVVLTDSGTSALHLALRLAVTENPGPVALPAYCCYDIATAADAAGVEFSLYDIDPGTLGPDWSSLRRALSHGARTIVVVHLYGIPVDLPAVSELARSVGAVVIEDAAQATGATIGGKPAGSLGTYAVLSFGRGKGMTGGRGGALLGPSDALRSLPALIRPSSSWRDAALLLAQWALARPSIYGLPLSIPSLRLGETIYCKPKPAGSPSRFALGALTQTLRLTAAEAHHRRANAAWLLDQLPPRATAVSPIVPEGCVAGYLRLPVVVQPIDMERFGTDRARTLGVWPGYPRALSDLEGFGARRCNPDEPTPGARVLARGLFTLPTHRLLCSKDRITLGRLLHSVAAIPQSRPDASA